MLLLGDERFGSEVDTAEGYGGILYTDLAPGPLERFGGAIASSAESGDTP